MIQSRTRVPQIVEGVYYRKMENKAENPGYSPRPKFVKWTSMLNGV